MPETNRHHPAPVGKESQEVETLAGTPYRALAKIGSGGHGTILDAEHRTLGKLVVVKLLLPKHASEPRLIERLQREARILARIASPHIVTVSDLGQTADGSTYVAMERLYGRTLGQELKTRGTLPVLEAIHWTREVLAGLGAAHRAGVVHRDIKLDNIFLCDATEHEPRRIKLLDFGIAKVLNNALAGMDLSRHQLTAEGTLLGSPRWLAPEQARGKAVDARVDIYAAGLLAYTLVAGRGPFSHISDAFEAIQASLGELPAPPSRYAPQHIPAALDDAILMAIEKTPDNRFQSAAAFAMALESIARSLEETTQPLPQQVAWAEADTEATQNRPCPPEQRESTAPTLARGPASKSRDAATRLSGAPALAIVSAPTAALVAESGGVSIGTFLALTVATTLVLVLVFGLVLHFIGGR